MEKRDVLTCGPRARRGAPRRVGFRGCRVPEREEKLAAPARPSALATSARAANGLTSVRHAQPIRLSDPTGRRRIPRTAGAQLERSRRGLPTPASTGSRCRPNATPHPRAHAGGPPRHDRRRRAPGARHRDQNRPSALPQQPLREPLSGLGHADNRRARRHARAWQSEASHSLRWSATAAPTCSRGAAWRAIYAASASTSSMLTCSARTCGERCSAGSAACP